MGEFCGVGMKSSGWSGDGEKSTGIGWDEKKHHVCVTLYRPNCEVESCQHVVDPMTCREADREMGPSKI